MNDLAQIKVQKAIAKNNQLYVENIVEYLVVKNKGWHYILNPTYDPTLNDCKIAILKLDELHVAMYIGVKGKLMLEPIVERESGFFGIGCRISAPITKQWDQLPRDVAKAIFSQTKKWQHDLAAFKERERQSRLNLEISLEYKQRFAAKANITINHNESNDYLVLPEIGRISFTHEGVKLGEFFEPISWQTAAKIVNIIRLENEGKATPTIVT